ncbi:MAG TPA: hypothetical protein VM029_21440 [Opitutaceae bacterium]|nr:hypothetical protein [Opitutaceae bacterium]
MNGQRKSRVEGVALFAAIGALVILLLAVFSTIMRSFDHNEGLYITAGWLVAHGRSLYADFSFWQMPYSAWLFAAVFRVFDPAALLFTGKIVAYIFWLAAVAAIAGFAWRETRRALPTAVAVLLFAGNWTVIRCASEASNYIQPLACALGSYVLALWAWADTRRAKWCWVASGACTGFAIGFKLYYLPTIAAYLAAIVWLPREVPLATRIRGAAVPFLAGVVIALLPVAYVFLRDPGVFWFNNLQVHHFTTEWWRETGVRYATENKVFDIPLTFAEKLRFAGRTALIPANGAILVGLLACLGRLCFSPASRPNACRPAVVLAAMLSAVGFVCAFAPTPMWPQYWGLPVPFFFLWFIALALPAIAQRCRATETVLMVAALIALVPAGRQTLRNVRLLPHTEWWPGVVMAGKARQMAALMPPAARKAPLATMQQLWAVESGTFTPMEKLAYAPFTYVIADRLAPEQRARFRIVGPADLSAHLAAQPPGAVVAGLYEDIFWSDRELEDWARQHGFQAHPAFELERFFTAASTPGAAPIK